MEVLLVSYEREYDAIKVLQNLHLEFSRIKVLDDPVNGKLTAFDIYLEDRAPEKIAEKFWDNGLFALIVNI